MHLDITHVSSWPYKIQQQVCSSLFLTLGPFALQFPTLLSHVKTAPARKVPAMRQITCKVVQRRWRWILILCPWNGFGVVYEVWFLWRKDLKYLYGEALKASACTDCGPESTRHSHVTGFGGDLVGLGKISGVGHSVCL